MATTLKAASLTEPTIAEAAEIIRTAKPNDVREAVWAATERAVNEIDPSGDIEVCDGSGDRSRARAEGVRWLDEDELIAVAGQIHAGDEATPNRRRTA